MNVSYGSQTIPLMLSLSTRRMNKEFQNEFKYNVKDKKFSQLASLMEGPLNLMSICSIEKIFFSTKVEDKQLNDKYSY